MVHHNSGAGDTRAKIIRCNHSSALIPISDLVSAQHVFHTFLSLQPYHLSHRQLFLLWSSSSSIFIHIHAQKVQSTILNQIVRLARSHARLSLSSVRYFLRDMNVNKLMFHAVSVRYPPLLGYLRFCLFSYLWHVPVVTQNVYRLIESNVGII